MSEEIDHIREFIKNKEYKSLFQVLHNIMWMNGTLEQKVDYCIKFMAAKNIADNAAKIIALLMAVAFMDKNDFWDD